MRSTHLKCPAAQLGIYILSLCRDPLSSVPMPKTYDFVVPIPAIPEDGLETFQPFQPFPMMVADEQRGPSDKSATVRACRCLVYLQLRIRPQALQQQVGCAVSISRRSGD